MVSTRFLALSVTVAGSALLLGHDPRPAQAQEETPKIACWAETCQGTVCVRVQIECPEELKPVKP